MIRKKRTLQLETLENREMLSANFPVSLYAFTESRASGSESVQYGPSAEEQEMLELMNRMRMDPQGELSRLIKSFSPFEAWDPRVTTPIREFPYPTPSILQREWSQLVAAPPLAWSSSLSVAAADHNYQMILADQQSHQLDGEPSLADRIIAAGFEPAYKRELIDGEYVDIATIAENVYAYGEGVYGPFSAASYIHAAFALDWGVPTHDHRNNIMDPQFTDVGISMVAESNIMTSVGPWVTTIDFSSSKASQDSDGAYLLGVVFDDLNSSGYYEAGEGVSDVFITISKDFSGEDPITITPFTAGGYQVFLENGTYSITVHGGKFFQPITKHAVVQGDNVKVDFTVQDLDAFAPHLDLNGPDLPGIDYHTSFYEGGDSKYLLSGLATLTDREGHGDGRVSSVIITLENRPDGASEFLTIDTEGTGLQASFDSSTGILLVFGDGSFADYLSVLKTLEYGNAGKKTDLSTRTVSFVVSNGVQVSEKACTNIQIVQQVYETVSVADVQIEEGDFATREMVFWVELTDVPRCEVFVEYQFVDGSAVLGTHYFGKSGTLIIPANETRGKITVEVFGDYLPGYNLEFSLKITDVRGAEFKDRTITGTIWDDDTPQVLGQITRWSVDQVDLADGHRRLYSFSPGKTGTVVWEALLSDGTPADARMQLYKFTHEGEPLVESVDFHGRSRIQFDIEEGTTYILLLEGEVLVDSLRMSQFFAVVDEGNNELQIHLDPTQRDRISINLRDKLIEYNGVHLPYEYNHYSKVGFRNVFPGSGIRIIGVPNSSGGLVIDPENPVFPGDDSGEDPIIDLDDFTYIEYYIDDPSTTVELLGTAGDDYFEFRDGVATFTTSTKKVYTVYGGKFFDVRGNGGNDQGLIYDTAWKDSVVLESSKVGFYGGGNSGYLIDVFDFNTVDINSYYGGGDVVQLVNENGSSALLDEWMVRRIEVLPNSEFARRYTTRGFDEVQVVQRDESETSVLIEGGTGTNRLTVSSQRIVASSGNGPFTCSVLGTPEVIWRDSASSGILPVIHYEQLHEEILPGWSGDGILHIPGEEGGLDSGRLVFTNTAKPAFYFNGAPSDLEDFLQSSSTLHDQVYAEGADSEDFLCDDETPSRTPEDLQDDSQYGVFAPMGILLEGEVDSFSNSNRFSGLSAADIALMYEDWDHTGEECWEPLFESEPQKLYDRVF